MSYIYIHISIHDYVTLYVYIYTQMHITAPVCHIPTTNSASQLAFEAIQVGLQGPGFFLVISSDFVSPNDFL